MSQISHKNAEITLPESQDGNRNSGAGGETSVFGSSGKQVQSSILNIGWFSNSCFLGQFVWVYLGPSEITWKTTTCADPGWPMLWFSSWLASQPSCRPSLPRFPCRYLKSNLWDFDDRIRRFCMVSSCTWASTLWTAFKCEKLVLKLQLKYFFDPGSTECCFLGCRRNTNRTSHFFVQFPHQG